MRITQTVALLFLTCLSICVPAAAELRPGSPVLVIDLRQANPAFAVVTAQTLNDVLGPSTPSPAELLKSACKRLSVQGLRASAKSDAASLSALGVVEKLLACTDCLKAFAEKRFYLTANDEVLLLIVYDSSVINPLDLKPVFVETPRKSELLSTGKALFGLLSADEREKPSNPTCEAFSYLLLRDRSYLKVQLPVPQPGDDPGAQAFNDGNESSSPSIQPRRIVQGIRRVVFTQQVPKPPDAEPPPGLSTPATAARKGTATTGTDAVFQSPELVMGPIERWFFSVDFSIPKFSKDLIKPSVAPTADATRLKDKDFFIGVNLALGDLLVDRESRLQRRALWQELVLKFHVTPSNRPWETWGAGFGLRGDRLKALLWNMDVVHPFVTVLRKETEEGGRWAVTGGFAFDPRSLQRK